MCFWGSSLKRGMAVTYCRLLYAPVSNYVASFFALNRFRYSDSQVFTGVSNFYDCLWFGQALSGSWRQTGLIVSGSNMETIVHYDIGDKDTTQ